MNNFNFNFDFQEEDEIIDLTSSFVLVNHCALSNEIIDLVSDAPLENSTNLENPNVKKKSSKTEKAKEKCTKILCNSKEVQTTMSKKIGACPICLDDFGNNPLASTKCGHVYCLQCLQQSLQVEKRCPTCRKMLRGKLAYHPIYLS